VSLLDVLLGPACDICGTRRKDRMVAKSLKLGMTLCKQHRQQEKGVRRSRSFPR
jgi:hypothetical protein